MADSAQLPWRPKHHAAATTGLNVVALVSGGKDSFFSLLHCLANGHRVVALANLHPPGGSTGAGDALLPEDDGAGAGHRPPLPAAAGARRSVATTAILPGPPVAARGSEGASSVGGEASSSSVMAAARLGDNDNQIGGEGHASVEPSSRHFNQGDDEADLNSFMYQTVGHQVVPLYAEATGLPLYRRTIVGLAVQHAREYASPSGQPHASSQSTTVSAGESQPHDSGPHDGLDPQAQPDDDEADETESMLALLRDIKAAHPEVNAVCAGAILSTYQRTRVESVAVRLGLVPLAYLWKYPVLPAAGPGAETEIEAVDDDAQLLRDLGAAGLDARIIKVASGGLDESFLWRGVADPGTQARLKRSMGRFAAASAGGAGDGALERGAVLGEGGEFETLVVDGPPGLFRARIQVDEADRRIVQEGGGSAWVNVRKASLVHKEGAGREGEAAATTRIPPLLDARFEAVLLEATQLDQPLSTKPSDEVPLRFVEWEWDTTSTAWRTSPSTLRHLNITAEPGQRGSVEAETASIVAQARRELARSNLTPASILQAVVVLQRMADFPTINPIYASLFALPNPPSRVTIACGEDAGLQSSAETSSLGAEHADARIAVYFTVHDGPLGEGKRQGLHVQSRSYWAPANIGPYSQAVSVPATTLFSSTTTSHPKDAESDQTDQPLEAGGAGNLVWIAGQIPLIPATTDLPPSTPSPSSPSAAFVFNATLSLQHLWRIGSDRSVAWWSGAVAYIPRVASSSAPALPAQEQALLAARIWGAAHRWSPPGQDEDDDEGPDLWDRRHDPRYMTYGADTAAAHTPCLPDWSVLEQPPSADPQQDEIRHRPLPALFTAEVETLPRGAAVEWHALLGHSGAVQEGSVRWVVDAPMRSAPAREGDAATAPAGTISHTALHVAAGKVMVHSMLAWQAPMDPQQQAPVTIKVQEAATHTRESVTKMLGYQLGPGEGEVGASVLDIVYVDRSVASISMSQDPTVVLPIIPCRSLWDGKAQRLAAVMVFKTLLVAGS